MSENHSEEAVRVNFLRQPIQKETQIRNSAKPDMRMPKFKRNPNPEIWKAAPHRLCGRISDFGFALKLGFRSSAFLITPTSFPDGE
jgi:hypothetical protein